MNIDSKTIKRNATKILSVLRTTCSSQTSICMITIIIDTLRLDWQPDKEESSRAKATTMSREAGVQETNQPNKKVYDEEGSVDDRCFSHQILHCFLIFHLVIISYN